MLQCVAAESGVPQAQNKLVIQRHPRAHNCLVSNTLKLSLSNIKGTTIVMKIVFITYRDGIHTTSVPVPIMSDW
jgi:hypothetical protein